MPGAWDAVFTLLSMATVVALAILAEIARHRKGDYLGGSSRDSGGSSAGRSRRRESCASCSTWRTSCSTCCAAIAAG